LFAVLCYQFFGCGKEKKIIFLIVCIDELLCAGIQVCRRINNEYEFCRQFNPESMIQSCRDSKIDFIAEFEITTAGPGNTVSRAR